MSEDKNIGSSGSLKPESKQKMLKFGVIAIVAIIAFIFIRSTGTHKLAEAEPEPVALGIGDNLLSDDVYESFQAENKKQDQVIEDMHLRLNDKDEQVSELLTELSSLKTLFDKQEQMGSLPSGENEEPLPPEFQSMPFPPAPGANPFPAPPGSANIPLQATAIEEETEWLGGLTVYEGEPVRKKSGKKKKQKFYMPPSFFGAKLLSGIDAMTNKEAMANPEQVMLMVDAPAVLPNHIKKDLKGCYVVANANGNLAKERVQLEVVSLSCLSSDGGAVIDQKVLGFVADNDGKRDLKGNVVARNGSNTALLMLASIVGAVGNQAALSTVTQTSNISSGTTTQSFDSDQALTAGFGSGIKDGTKEYKNILVDYIRQSSPVVEVGVLKEATVFIQKGVWLEIMDTSEMESENEKLG